MPRIIVPSRRVWTRQPQRAVEIDWSNPITQGLVSCWLHGLEVVKNRDWKSPNGYGRSASKFGLGASLTAASSQYLYVDEAVDPAVNTMFVIARPTTSVQGRVISLGTASATARVTLSWLASAQFQITTDTGSGPITSSTTVNDFHAVAAVSSGGSARTIYLDKVETSSGIGSGTGQSRIYIGCQCNSVPNVFFTGEIPFAAVFNRALTAKEIESLTDRPWQIFKPRTRRTIIDLGMSGLSSVYADSALTYYIRSLLSSDSGIQYAIRNAIYKDDAVGYFLRSAIAQNSEVGYVLRSAIAKDDAEAYKIRGLVQASDAEAYSIRGLVQASDGEAYKIRSQVQADTSTSYDIQSSTSVASSNAVNYSVRGVVAASVLVGYSVRGSAQRDAASAYSVRSAASRDVVASYAVSASASSVYADSTASYLVDGVVPSGPSAESIAAAVLAAMHASPPPTNTVMVNHVPLQGDGTPSNPWNPA